MMAGHDEWCASALGTGPCCCTHRWDDQEPPEWYLADQRFMAIKADAKGAIAIDCDCRVRAQHTQERLEAVSQCSRPCAAAPIITPIG